ncbi:MFS transporter [Yersinia mollaretii]|uniref:MFS transporter n=1 Tax=Yersinia mollaretii TaxID=33060 RepID=UPI0028F432B7|nr:MFS transporter [Yersinia mollaretii]
MFLFESVCTLLQSNSCPDHLFQQVNAAGWRQGTLNGVFMAYQQKGIPANVLRICGIAALGGILFGYLSSQFHGAFPMWIFAICCLFSYWFICRFVPETKGVALEHMEEAMLAKRSKTSLSEPVPSLPSESK